MAAWEFEDFAGKQPVSIPFGKKLPRPHGRQKVSVTDLLAVEGATSTRGQCTAPVGSEAGDGISGARKKTVAAPAPPLPGTVPTDDNAEKGDDAVGPSPPPAATSSEKDVGTGGVRKEAVATRRRWSPSRAAAAAKLCHSGGGARKQAASVPFVAAEWVASAVVQTGVSEGGAEGNHAPSMRRSASQPALPRAAECVLYFSDHAFRGGRARRMPRPISTV